MQTHKMQTGTETGTSSQAGGTAPVTGTENAASGRLQATAPGQLRVIKRNGTVTSFEDSKISVAITKAFLAVEGGTAAASSRIHETVAKLTEQVIATFKRRMPSGGTIHIEDIQDQVELALMRAGEHRIARDYVIYREERSRDRAAKAALSPESQAAASGINVVTPDGRWIGRLDHIFKDQLAVAEAQILQEDVASVEVRIVPRMEFDDRAEASLMREIRSRLGEEIRIELRRVDQIPREENGKFRAVKSTVGRNVE